MNIDEFDSKELEDVKASETIASGTTTPSVVLNNGGKKNKRIKICKIVAT
jgi:hypothetical protein